MASRPWRRVPEDLGDHLGRPPCAIVDWGITILETAVYAREPVRLEVVGHIADILKIPTMLIGVIVVAWRR